VCGAAEQSCASPVDTHFIPKDVNWNQIDSAYLIAAPSSWLTFEAQDFFLEQLLAAEGLTEPPGSVSLSARAVNTARLYQPGGTAAVGRLPTIVGAVGNVPTRLLAFVRQTAALPGAG